MIAINDITEYKMALVLVPDIEKALAELKSSAIKLEKYRHLRAVSVLLNINTDSITLLEIALEQQRHIIKTKGLHVIQD